MEKSNNTEDENPGKDNCCKIDNKEENLNKKLNKKLTTEEVVDLIVKDIEFHNNIERKIIEEQERTWLKFMRPIPRKVKKEIPSIIKEKTGNRVKWLKDGCLVVEFFSEDELAEIRHRRTQKKVVDENIEVPKPHFKKKRRENIPKPPPKEPNDSSKFKSKPYNKKNSSSHSKHFKSHSQK